MGGRIETAMFDPLAQAGGLGRSPVLLGTSLSRAMFAFIKSIFTEVGKWAVSLEPTPPREWKHRENDWPPSVGFRLVQRHNRDLPLNIFVFFNCKCKRRCLSKLAGRPARFLGSILNPKIASSGTSCIMIRGNTIVTWEGGTQARDIGVIDDVLTVEELRTGDDTRGTGEQPVGITTNNDVGS